MGMDVFGKEPSNQQGQYFRASIWGWRPLLEAMEHCCGDLLGEELINEMSYNDGAGVGDQKTCSLMATRLETFLAAHPDGVRLDSDVRVDREGKFVGSGETDSANGGETFSPYHADPELFHDWINFLRHCGGFEVH